MNHSVRSNFDPAMRLNHIEKTSRKHREEVTRQDRAQEKSLNHQLQTFQKDQERELRKFASAKRELENHYKKMQGAKSPSVTDLREAVSNEESSKSSDNNLTANDGQKKGRRIRKRSKSFSGVIVRDELSKLGCTRVIEFNSTTSLDNSNSSNNSSTDSLSSACTLPALSFNTLTEHLYKRTPHMSPGLSRSLSRSSEKIHTTHLPSLTLLSPNLSRKTLTKAHSNPPTQVPPNTPVPSPGTRRRVITLTAALSPLALSPGMPRRKFKGNNKGKEMTSNTEKDEKDLNDSFESLQDCRYLSKGKEMTSNTEKDEKDLNDSFESLQDCRYLRVRNSNS